MSPPTLSVRLRAGAFTRRTDVSAKMYEKIRTRKSVPDLYEARLKVNSRMRRMSDAPQESKVVSESQAADYRKAYVEQLDAALSGVDAYKSKSEMLQGKWSQLVWPATSQAEHQPSTGVTSETLKEVGQASVTLPDSFVCALSAHLTSGLMMAERPFATEASHFRSNEELGKWRQDRLCYRRGYGVWHTYEARIRYPHLRPRCGPRHVLPEVSCVPRFSAQARHAMFVDQETESCYVPLNESINAGKGRLELANSGFCESI